VPATLPPPRTAVGPRLRMRAAYRWRNSGHPLVTRLRTAWDTRDYAVFPAIRSDLGGLSVSYSGLPEGLAYTLEFTELRRQESEDDTAERVSRTLTGRALADPTALPDADIVIVGTSAARARRLPQAASLVIPMRVHFVVDIDGDAEAMSRRISRRERWQFSRNQRDAGWRWFTDDDPAWFDIFYDRMYRPTMRNRHGERERTESKDVSYECLFRTGRMFVLARGDERIGGALCHWHDRTGVLTLRLLGVLDGATDHYTSGAFKAIYHFLIGWAAANGVRRVDFQGTEPFLSKGTYQWKRRFGTRVILPPNHFGHKSLWLNVRRDTAFVRDFLVDNPLLAETDDGILTAVYFSDADRPAREQFSSKSPGVDRVRHVDLDTFLAGVPSTIQGESRS
jgi:hypothetical protein